MPLVAGNAYIKAVDEDTMLGPANAVVFDASEGFHRTYVRRWRIQTIDPNKTVGPVMIMKWAPFIPLPFAPYVGAEGDSDINAFAIRFKVERDPAAGDAWDQWLLTVDYSTKLPAMGVQFWNGTYWQNWTGVFNRPANEPWFEKPHIEWDTELVSVAPQVDLNGKLYQNSARMPFIPAPTVQKPRAILVIERNEYNIDGSLVEQYANGLNRTPLALSSGGKSMLIRPPETVQILPIRAVQDYKGDVSFFKVTYRLRLARSLPDGTYEKLQPRYLDAGTHQLNIIPGVLGGGAVMPFAGMPVPIYRGPHPVVNPVVLDGVGRELKPNASGVWDFSKSWIDFVEYPLVNMTNILTSGLSSAPP